MAAAALCCLGQSCRPVTAETGWCSGASSSMQCHRWHTESRPCVWTGKWCTKGSPHGSGSVLECPPPIVPTVMLNTGASMPMLAFGTGMLPLNSVRAARRLRSTGKSLQAISRRSAAITRRSALPHLNTSLALGYTHIDTSESYPDFDSLGALLQPHRRRLFITSKIDPTATPPVASLPTCQPDGGGCDQVALIRANDTRRRLRLVPDLLLLHKPPPRPAVNDPPGQQCRQLQGYWSGLEAAQSRGLAR